MKKNLISAISLILTLVMLLGAFASCKNNGNTETDAETSGKTETTVGDTAEKSDSTESVESSEETTSAKESGSETSGDETVVGGDTDTDSKETDSAETTSENKTTETTEKADVSETESEKSPVIASKNDALIEAANSRANGVQAYFTDASRVYFTVENQEMSLNYARNKQVKQQVESLKNTKGASYIENTMDIFVRMSGAGTTFYASNSSQHAQVNLYRLGYYYYEALFEYQNFALEDFSMENEQKIDVNGQLSTARGVKKEYNNKTGEVTFTVTNTSDPYFVYGKNFSYATDSATGLIVTAKSTGTNDGMAIYIDTGKGYSETQRLDMVLIPDGEYHTYYVTLASCANYTGNLVGLRFDPRGDVGDSVTIQSISLGEALIDDLPMALSINRHFHVYSDKMHHAVQFAVTEKTENIAEIGMMTKIDANTVSKLIVVTSDSKTYDSLDAGFDWADVVAVAFDVTEAGVFGYILPDDEIAGKLKVELVDGVYVIEQTRTPSADGVDGVILPSIDTEKRDSYGHYVHADGVKNNGNDFYLGQRIYTDENHDFAEFLKETYFERNPIDEKRINVTGSAAGNASYAGYDAMRGIYVFKVATPGGGFTAPYDNPGKDYKANFKIRAKEDRGIYVMTLGTGGNLECAVLMDNQMMMLPVPIEVIKNFSEPNGERNLYNISDPTFSEAIVYIDLKENAMQEYTLINLYQNWGNYPLKQFSQIAYQMPYYHLSTGVTETNCILPWFQTDTVKKVNSSTLPDFRSMSAPFWKGQPQHNNCGTHQWLDYTSTEGGPYYVETVYNDIISHGPTYAELRWENISDDGKIKVTYTHMEMPQVDENRGYYTIEYEFLDELTIESFKDNFKFYTVGDNDPEGSYKKIGYLNESNECVVIDSNQDENAAPEYILGDECPYFSFFMMPDWDREYTGSEGYANVSFLIYTYDFVIGGEKQEHSFLIRNRKNKIELTLNISDTVTFKAGDKITINALLMPWGSQEYEDGITDPTTFPANYEYTDVVGADKDGNPIYYMDKNVRDVRENTLLNPLTVKSETDYVLESVYLPKVKSRDGKTAEFTLSGGENNVAVRIYGFNRLTAPKVEEFVDGRWQPYVLSSHQNPDAYGYYHYYDGYAVYYDEDGSYSYSFVTTMYDGAPRKFRISADTEFEGWPEEIEPEIEAGPLNVYDSPEKLASIMIDSDMFGKVETVNDDDGFYTSAYVKPGNPYNESYATFYSAPSDTFVSGQYLVIKYRVPSTNSGSVGNLEIFAASEPANAFNSGSFAHKLTADGEWHVDIIDLSKTPLVRFAPDENGNYCTRFVRIDVFNGNYKDPDLHVDFAYIGMDSDLTKICELEAENFEYLNYYENGVCYDLDVATATPVIKTYLDPSSGFTESTEIFGSVLDYLGTDKAGVGSNTQNGGIVTVGGGAKLDENGKLRLAGWCCVNGGIDRYVYSLDGGKTWSTCEGTPITAYDEIVDTAQNYSGSTFDDYEAARVNGRFQGTARLYIDLNNYIGQKVNIVFAAVPKNDTSTLVLLYYFENIECTIG